MSADTRWFPIREGRPHIFRSGGEWRVYLHRMWLDNVPEYQSLAIQALTHIKRMTAAARSENPGS